MEEKEILNQFGEMFINDVRTQTLSQLNKIFSGELKSEAAKQLHSKLNHFSADDMKIIKEVATIAVDRALFKVMYMFESSEDFIIGAVNDEEIINLNDISDGLGGEYYKWIDEFSEKE